jgi:hypothetical protein
MFRSLVLSLSLSLLVGCGGGSQMGGGNNGGGNGQTFPPVTSFAESWHFAPPSNSSSIEAALTLSSSSVVGVGHLQSPVTAGPCPDFSDIFPLSGTIDGQGNFSVKSSPGSGLVLFLSGVLASDLPSVSSGSYGQKHSLLLCSLPPTELFCHRNRRTQTRNDLLYACEKQSCSNGQYSKMHGETGSPCCRAAARIASLPPGVLTAIGHIFVPYRV